MNAHEAIKTSMQSPDMNWQSYIGDLDDANLFVRPVEGANHIAWQLGHLIVAENGFSDPYVSQVTIPYMSSPASRHGRQERVFTFSAYKERPAEKPERYAALPDWIVTGKDPVPLAPSFRQQAMTTQIYSFIMSLIDGKRSIKEMAVVLENQKLMTKEEAEPAIRSFMTKMYDDSKRQAGF